jgi:hypothetical protein
MRVIAASDVYIRDHRLFVPSDCVAALTAAEQHNALKLMKKNFDVTTTRLDLEVPSRGSFLKEGFLLRNCRKNR